MTDRQEMRAALLRFGNHYDYDVGYLQEMLAASQGAYEAYLPVQGMSSFREALPLDAHHVARVATMQAEDCGACARLSLRMALEAGVSRDLLETLLCAPQTLPAPLADVREHARTVASGQAPDLERTARLRAVYGDDGLAELAVCIAGARIYPALKRALGYAPTCERLSLDA